jgi:hypothetical protein
MERRYPPLHVDAPPRIPIQPDTGETGAHTAIGVMLKGLFTTGGLRRCRTCARRATRATIGRDYVPWELCAGFVLAHIRYRRGRGTPIT